MAKPVIQAADVAEPVAAEPREPASKPRSIAPAGDMAAPAPTAGIATPVVLTSVTGSPIRAISLLFDPDWYLKTYPDVAAAGLDPIRHFFEDGAREGRNPNAFFKTEWYLAQNQDVVASKVNPFLHYLLYGAREGRKPGP
ncbi:hypothetical protein [Lichenicola sp.]|uniref:hypothetical protein n=1 Tax=Lichenicola sp. TaxID=2804529 RepID=UPI003AFF7BF3